MFSKVKKKFGFIFLLNKEIGFAAHCHEPYFSNELKTL